MNQVSLCPELQVVNREVDSDFDSAQFSNVKEVLVESALVRNMFCLPPHDAIGRGQRRLLRWCHVR